MKEYIDKCRSLGMLRVIDDELDTQLEIPHIAYIEAKKDEPKVLLFTNPVCKQKGIKYKYPVVMNVFASKKALELIIGDADDIANQIRQILNMHMPSGFINKLEALKKLFALRSIAPKRRQDMNAPCFAKQISLKDIPILKTWSDDGGDFITMGQVYTRSLDGKQNNLGMYRLQVHDYEKGILGMHFQLHKDASHFFYEYKKAKQKMPVAVAIGDDPLHILCAQAPLPKGIFELMLYGFIKKRGAKLTKCHTNEIYVPSNSDFVIEGYIDPDEMMIEGPLGDHTGFYTKALEYPIMHAQKIWAKSNAIYNATVVGKPPLEDRWMGYATERIFLPLLQTSVPDLVDYKMPENGVFHNLILAKINNLYPSHATQIMHAFFGVGQLSFVKHAIFVDESAPDLDDYAALVPYMLDRFDAQKMYFCDGIIDELDHASEYCFGSKLGVDLCGECGFDRKEPSANGVAGMAGVAGATNEISLDSKIPQTSASNERLILREHGERAKSVTKSLNGSLSREDSNAGALPSATNEISPIEPLDTLIDKIHQIKGVVGSKVYYQSSRNPIVCVRINKLKSIKNLIDDLDINFACWRAIVVFVDGECSIDSPYMLVWRVVNNIDARRDIFVRGDVVFVDASKKHIFEGFEREWPDEVLCDKATIKSLIERKLIIDDENLYKKYEIY